MDPIGSVTNKKLSLIPNILLMFSSKIKYLISGILAYLSVVAIFASSPTPGSDGKFGDYFVRMTWICPAGEVIIWYYTGNLNYGTKNCTSLKTLFRNIFGSDPIPADSSLIGFWTPAGTLVYTGNIWKTNANGISYTGSRVGIGTNTPWSMLDVVDGDINISPVWWGNIIVWASSAGTVKISDMNSSYFNGGYVGIWTSTPGTSLEVIGNTKISSQLVVKNIILDSKPLKIPVVCTGQGKWLHWDGSNWSCIAMPIEWSCNNAVANTCTYGTPTGYAAGSCGWTATWTCSGLNGWGSNTSCNKANPPCPVNCSYTTTGWWACSASCGGGTQSSTYHITVPAANGGTCAVSEWQVAATQACNTHSCIPTTVCGKSVTWSKYYNGILYLSTYSSWDNHHSRLINTSTMKLFDAEHAKKWLNDFSSVLDFADYLAKADSWWWDDFRTISSDWGTCNKFKHGNVSTKEKVMQYID